MAAAAWIRHFFNLRHVGKTKPSILVTGAIAMLAIALWVSWPQTPAHVEKAGSESESDNKSMAVVTDERVTELVNTHCVGCHSRTPTDDIFKVAPLGVVLDSWEDITRYAPQLVRRTTVTKDMPFLNKTGMTEEERAEIAAWFATTHANKEN